MAGKKFSNYLPREDTYPSARVFKRKTPYSRKTKKKKGPSQLEDRISEPSGKPLGRIHVYSLNARKESQ